MFPELLRVMETVGVEAWSPLSLPDKVGNYPASTLTVSIH